MKGIQCAFTGKLGQDAELKTSKHDKPWSSFSVAVDMEASEEATTWVRVAVFGEMATRLCPELKKGTEVYCEGRLRLDSWTGRDGREHSGLRVAAAKVEVLGRIGYDPYQRKPKPEPPPLNHPELEGQGRSSMEDLPF
jgi:single stranded DNA-binding protein